jgi:hypothetical protein
MQSHFFLDINVCLGKPSLPNAHSYELEGVVTAQSILF